MRRSILFFMAIAIFTFFILNSAISQKILYSLPHGEQLLYAESFLAFFDSQEGIQVCTTDEQGRFYVFKNNRKLGPFNDLDEATGLIVWPDDWHDDYPGSGAIMNQAYNDDYVTWDNNEGCNYIKAGNKRLGPFQSVKDLYVSPDGKNYIAIVAEIDPDYTYPPEYQLISATNPGIKLKGEPNELHVSRSVKSGVVSTRFEKTEDIDMDVYNEQQAMMEKMITDWENEEFSLDELMELSMQINEINSMAEESTREYYVYLCDNKVFGPFTTELYGSLNPGFGINSGERWHMVADGKLYINGNHVMDVEEGTVISDFWWSLSGNNYAYSTYESIVFSTGESFPYPLEVKAVEENGKTVIKWLSLENEKDFIFYQKTL
jgi:hypothetical protein